ncbi:hypothetical protein [Parablautia intestinalis]|uniref:hypothetical protein n=1 Tax=Parablautia intestinalis TaxID=2320100 RepID=UPI00256ED9D3|nr:hypothetical protein [Parablautia intestinalis]
MDLSETTREVINRHPWELSRTQCTLKVFSKYIAGFNGQAVYINSGAGDLYFDKKLLEKYEKSQVHAIDIAYKDKISDDKRIHKYHFLEEMKEEWADYAVMMDSLEYMEDDAGYIRDMVRKIKKGGYFFFTLPAFPILFSDYDINIKNLRRYSRKSFSEVLDKVTGLQKVEEHYFYSSLFMIRFVQKMLHLSIDPEHKFTANWNYAEEHFVTRFLTVCLNLDFLFNRLFSKIGIRFPGLSMLVICKKTG